MTCTKLYVEEQLTQHFNDMIHYVKYAEAAAKQKGVAEGRPIPGYTPVEAAPIVKDFATRWTSAIEALNKYGLLSLTRQGVSLGQLCFGFSRLLA
jgi:hypothetical protein